MDTDAIRQYVQYLLTLDDQERAAELAARTPEEVEAILYHWPAFARDAQLLPEQKDPADTNWTHLIALTGRGFGKTRMAMEAVRYYVESGIIRPGQGIGIIGRTASDVRDVLVEGPSGILSITPPGRRPRWERTLNRITWPGGVIGYTFSAEEYERLRGPNLALLVMDELASWQWAMEAYKVAMLTLRVGISRVIIATTPKPVPIVRYLLSLHAADPQHYRVVRGSTWENAPNLSEAFLGVVVGEYKGTHLERQELFGEEAAQAEHALWTYAMFEQPGFRAAWDPPAGSDLRAVPELQDIVVGLDPSAKQDGRAGIIVTGIGVDGRLYVLEDATMQGSPAQWAERAIACVRKWGASRIIAETQHGGKMVQTTIAAADPTVRVVEMPASQSKAMRAQPVSLLYEQGRISHVGVHPHLEEELLTWEPNDRESPDRMDALVWSVAGLMPHLLRPAKQYGTDYGILVATSQGVLTPKEAAEHQKKQRADALPKAPGDRWRHYVSGF